MWEKVKNIASRIYNSILAFYKSAKEFGCDIVVCFKWLNYGIIQLFSHNSAWEFSYIWWILIVGFGLASLTATCCWGVSMWVIGVMFALITALILIKPMNAVYGMMGTRGSIRVFFFTFIIITLLFTTVYHFAFFKDAGISYDVNQPHIDYNMYCSKMPKNTIPQWETIVYRHQAGAEWISDTVVKETTLNYQPVHFMQTWRNTILTALMQEPTDLFAVASTYNESIVDPSLTVEEQTKEILLDKQKSMAFQWVLIFQVLISWIFFGVFISLLYNKFRHES